jgi:hypothetical protein
MMPTEDQIADAIEDATRRAIADLFQKHPEHFYYCALVTTGEAHAPVLVAWSKEALAGVADKQGVAKAVLKWSSADSPYYGHGESFFADVRGLFNLRPEMSPHMTDDQWKSEYALRLRAMECAMARLDSEGTFGTGRMRCQTVINVEVMPPDSSNTDRALRLNPKEALQEWLAEAAE